MKNFLFFFFALKAIISVNYEYEPIKENIPKSSCLIFPGEFKIYEYIPLLNNDLNGLNETKSVFIKIDESSSLYIYIYDNYSKIEQDSYGEFINYIDELSILEPFKKLENLTCNKAYYFVLLNRDNGRYSEPVDYQFFILDEINDIIQLNPSLSNDYNFFQTSNKPMKFYYKYEKNKITLIRLIGQIKFQIFENDKLIYNHDSFSDYKLLNYTFIKNNEYNIIFEEIFETYIDKPTIYFQFFDDEKFLKFNFTQSSLLLQGNYEYLMEVDISKYYIGENIIFLLFSFSEFKIQYQYKNEYKGNNLINLGRTRYGSLMVNYIRIKKEKDDNNLIINLIINIKPPEHSGYSSINLLKYEVQDISSDTEDLLVTEEKVLYLDYFYFNQYDSFGIYSKQKFLFLQQSICNSTTTISNCEKGNLKIIKKEFYSFYYIKNALIFFSKKLNNSFPLVLEFKKFNFPIIYKSRPEFRDYPIKYESKINQYLQLSQNKEFYFYVNNYDIIDYIDVFLPIFGKYETFFIKEEDIETLSDFDFDKKNESDYYICGKYKGYLKIKNLNNFSMLQHFLLDFFHFHYGRELETGKKYHFLIKELIDYKIYLTIKATYVNKNIALKFRVFGLNQNKSIVMLFDENR